MKHQLFVGTTNISKIEEFKLYLQNAVTLIGPQDLNITVKVPENNEDIQQNAERKVVMWSQAQEYPTLCDDTGFFVKALNGKPGVSVKTFGGELSETRTTDEWIAHLLKRTQGLPTGCYFERVVAFAKAGTLIGTLTDRLHGTLLQERPQKVSDSYPLAGFFIPEESNRVWSSLSETEKQNYDVAIAQKLQNFIIEHQTVLWE